MLYIETDYSPDDKGQMSTRIEAFLESLKNRRKRRT
jgi:benzoyl-CoA reductase/2-hydroxyglutaryl-CoA dehydratase subunit BcrC/BadD/HgdB